MQAGRVREALALPTTVFECNPGMVEPGLNLAIAQLQAGDKAGATVTLRRVLRFHPDSARARGNFWVNCYSFRILMLRNQAESPWFWRAMGLSFFGWLASAL
ncbi:MAG: tetratricopeptide repeat protein [Bryobacteraceae bacterium]